MNWIDAFLLGTLLGSAGFVAWHFIWKRRGHCLGCPSEGGCAKKCSHPESTPS